MISLADALDDAESKGRISAINVFFRGGKPCVNIQNAETNAWQCDQSTTGTASERLLVMLTGAPPLRGNDFEDLLG